MALHSNFPKSPHEILSPELRWFPADEALREKGYEKLLPPLVVELRKRVKEFRDSDYNGASETSKSLLRWWFQTEHLLPNASGINADRFFRQAQDRSRLTPQTLRTKIS